MVSHIASRTLVEIGPASIEPLIAELGRDFKTLDEVKAAVAAREGRYDLSKHQFRSLPDGVVRADGSGRQDPWKLIHPFAPSYAALTLGVLGEPGAPRLIEKLRAPRPNARANAAAALATMALPEAREAMRYLVPLLGDPEWLVRWTAAVALRRLAPASEPAVPALVEALRDGNPLVQRSAANALGALAVDAPRVVPALAELLEATDSSGVATSAVEALAKFGAEAAPAAGALVSAFRFVRWERSHNHTFTMTIARVGPALVPELRRALGSEEPNVRCGAAEVLARLGAPCYDLICYQSHLAPPGSSGSSNEHSMTEVQPCRARKMWPHWMDMYVLRSVATPRPVSRLPKARAAKPTGKGGPERS